VKATFQNLSTTLFVSMFSPISCLILSKTALYRNAKKLQYGCYSIALVAALLQKCVKKDAIFAAWLIGMAQIYYLCSRIKK